MLILAFSMHGKVSKIFYIFALKCNTRFLISKLKYLNTVYFYGNLKLTFSKISYLNKVK